MVSVPVSRGRFKLSADRHDARVEQTGPGINQPEGTIRRPARVSGRSRVEEEPSVLLGTPGPVAVTEQNDVGIARGARGRQGGSTAHVAVKKAKGVSAQLEPLCEREHGAHLARVVVAVHGAERGEGFESKDHLHLREVAEMEDEIRASELGEQGVRQRSSAARHVRVGEDDDAHRQ